MRNFFSILILAASSVTAEGQTSVGVPNLGFVYDSSAKALRPIWGVAGSAFFGAPVELGYDVLRSVPIPERNLILAATADAVYAVRLRSEEITSVPLAGLTGSPDLLRTSPGGTVAAIYYSETNTMFLVGALDSDSPTVSTVSLASVGRPLMAVTVSDDGRLVLAVTPGEDASTELHLIHAESGVSTLLNGFTHPSAPAFFRDSHDAVIPDAGAKSVVLFRNVDSDGERTVLWSSEDEEGLAIDAAQVSRDNAQVVVAGHEGRFVLITNILNGETRRLACRCKPSKVQALSIPGLYLLTDVAGGIAWLLDTNGDGRLLFIPPEIAASPTRTGRYAE